MWDSGKQYSYLMQRLVAGDPAFSWVGEMIKRWPEPPPGWEAVDRQQGGKFKEFPSASEAFVQNKLVRLGNLLRKKALTTEAEQLVKLLKEIR